MQEQYFQQGLEKLEQKEYQESIERFTLAIQNDPHNHKLYRWRAYPKNEINDKDGAVTDMTKALSLTDDTATKCYYQGVIHRYKNENEEALKCYNQGIALNPDHTLLSYLYYSRSFVSMSFNDLELALQYNPDNIMALKRKAYLLAHAK